MKNKTRIFSAIFGGLMVGYASYAWSYAAVVSERPIQVSLEYTAMVALAAGLSMSLLAWYWNEALRPLHAIISYTILATTAIAITSHYYTIYFIDSQVVSPNYTCPIAVTVVNLLVAILFIMINQLYPRLQVGEGAAPPKDPGGETAR